MLGFEFHEANTDNSGLYKVPALVTEQHNPDIIDSLVRSSVLAPSVLIMNGLARRLNRTISANELANTIQIVRHIVYQGLPASWPEEDFLLVPTFAPNQKIIINKSLLSDLPFYQKEKYQNYRDYMDLVNRRRQELLVFLNMLPIPPEYPFQSFIQDVLNASAVEAKLVAVMATWINNIGVQVIMEHLRNVDNVPPLMFLSDISGISEDELMRIFTSGKLKEIGLISQNSGNHGFLFTIGVLGEGSFTLNTLLHSALSSEIKTSTDFANQLRGRPVEAPENLSWDDFDHLGEPRNILKAFMESPNFDGGNILLVGPSGTGKTVFASVLAKEFGKRLYAVGEQTNSGKEPTRQERISALRVAMNIPCNQSILLMDEAKDVLCTPMFGMDRFTFSKAFLNTLLTSIKSPVIWTVNSVDGIDEAILRRMSLVIPFNPPNAKVRAKIWEHHLQDKGIHDITPEEMAKTWAVSAGLGATAVHTAHIAGLGGKGINDILDGFSRVVGDLRAKDSDDIPDFDPEISETTEDLKTMVELLLSSRRKDWSMCLFGPSGTGKSAFARYVANALGMEVLLKRGSDLMDKYVGQTEKLIADAFAEARQGKKVLIMDEVDSMLMNRETATHSWEITKVNEMLTQMETHPFPFFATTNLMQDLDKAALRRFTFKMEFKEIPSHKMKRAFEKIIGLPAPEGIYWPARVSAGDLAVLKKRADILGITDARVIGRWIEEEVSIKTGGRAGRIGY